MQSNSTPISLIIAITGASGSLYGLHLLRALLSGVNGHSTLIVSPAAIRVFNQEFDTSLQTPVDLLRYATEQALREDHSRPILHSFEIADYRDIGARPASGSAPYHGMVICPCSMKTIAGIAAGYTSNLIERAADVTIKERRRLIVVPREAPYSLIHLRNMTAITEAGGIVLPASPAFYQKPKSFDDLGRFIAGRILALLGLSQNLFQAWEGDTKVIRR
jgi:4-hydroxy-3-polyprenylbenzoate decarboxylase